MFGFFLVIVGVIWLLSSLGIITADMAEVIWPVVVIVLGLAIIIRPRPWHSVIWKKDKDSK